LETSGTKVNGLHETFFILKKIFSLHMDSRGQKLRIFRKRKMPITYIGHLKMGFYKVFNKKSCKKLFRQLRKKKKA
jgi:hypothetical protein